MRKTISQLLGLCAVLCFFANFNCSSVHGDVLLSGFENTFDTIIPGMPWHKDLSPNGATGVPDILDTTFITGGPNEGVTEGDWALEINHPPAWSGNEFYLILSDQGDPEATGEETFLEMIAQTDSLSFDVTTFAEDVPFWRQIFVVFNGSIIGWYDQTNSGDFDVQQDYLVADPNNPIRTETVTLSLLGTQAGFGDGIDMQAPANEVLTDHTDGTPLDPFYWQLYLIFQGGDEVTLDTVRIVMDNFRLTGAVTAPPVLDGDFDFNGEVNGGDFLLWQRDPSVGSLADWEANYGAPILDGDFDFDGDVDGDDFLFWQLDPSVGSLADWEANYGATSLAVAAVSAVVPEPSSAVLALGLLALGLYSRPSHRRTIQH